LRICFVTGFGKLGAERQTSLLIRLLSQHHKVDVVGFVPAETKASAGDWLSISDAVRYRMGYVNYYVFALAALTKVLRKLDPDVCIQRAVGDLTGFVGTYCRIHNCRFIYHSASNGDPQSSLALELSGSPLRFAYYTVGLLLADAIAAQTWEIAARFRRKYHGMKEIQVVPQVYDAANIIPSVQKEGFVLWIARLIWYKRPEIFIDLAQSMPSYRFIMAGGGPMESYVKTRTKNVPNLSFLGPIGHQNAEELCGNASVFVNTSVIEGFPNTLLECAARETPFIAMSYDPDEIICKNRIGFHSRSFEELRRDVRSIMDDARLGAELGRNGREYVIANHSPKLGLQAYERLLSHLPVRQR